MGKIVILSAAKNLLTRWNLRDTTEILRCAQNDGFLDFAVVLRFLTLSLKVITLYTTF